MNRLHRDVRAAVKALPVKLLELAKDRGHSYVVVQYGERMKTITFSGTPGSNDVAVKNVIRDIKRFIEGRYT